MVIKKSSQYKTKIPKAFKTRDPNTSIDGDKKKKCPICAKTRSYIAYAKPQNINEHDCTLYYVSKCNSCNYIHLEPVRQEQREQQEKE